MSYRPLNILVSKTSPKGARRRRTATQADALTASPFSDLLWTRAPGTGHEKLQAFTAKVQADEANARLAQEYFRTKATIAL